MNGLIFKEEFLHFQNSPATFKLIVTVKMQTRRSIQKQALMKFIFLEDRILGDAVLLKTQ